ncbi:predicted protein [Histoplasma capsulatum H143]|uniref:Uncharacterized protein n=1 Tax=Ajellomyces capsulatus (strain H143) TaxID=544712 RepID=C6H8R1_AJECH|nr:predicted protein [Histoplasma capsulatum H143]
MGSDGLLLYRECHTDTTRHRNELQLDPPKPPQLVGLWVWGFTGRVRPRIRRRHEDEALVAPTFSRFQHDPPLQHREYGAGNQQISDECDVRCASPCIQLSRILQLGIQSTNLRNPQRLTSDILQS